MKVCEALKAVQSTCDMWVRPVSWQGSGTALFVTSNDLLLVVPSLTGGGPWVPFFSELTEEWELVKINKVLEESYEQSSSN